MGAELMGRVVVRARIENLADLYCAARGLLDPEKIRSIEVDDALVDTGATMLCLPRRPIQQLGLGSGQKRLMWTAAGAVEVEICDAVKLSIQGRDCTIDVAATDDDCPVLVGQVPLELLDFVVDPKGQRLIGNPAHGGQQMFELYTYVHKP